MLIRFIQMLFPTDCNTYFLIIKFTPRRLTLILKYFSILFRKMSFFILIFFHTFGLKQCLNFSKISFEIKKTVDVIHLRVAQLENIIKMWILAQKFSKKIKCLEGSCTLPPPPLFSRGGEYFISVVPSSWAFAECIDLIF